MHAVFAVPFAVIGVVFCIHRSASKATGHSFYYLKGAAALLELAMVQYAVQKLTAKVWPSAKCQQTNVCVCVWCVCVCVCVSVCVCVCACVCACMHIHMHECIWRNMLFIPVGIPAGCPS